MFNFFIIASFHKNKNLVGYRVFDYKNGNIEDYLYNDLKSKILAGMNIANADVNDGEIVGTNGSLAKLTKISYTNGSVNGNTPLIMINKIGKYRYTLVDFAGNSKILNKQLVIEMYNKYGIANCKIRNVNNDYVISSIFGNIPQLPDNTENEGKAIHSCKEYYINQSKNLNMPDKLKELNYYICKSLDDMGKPLEDVMNIIDNNLDRDMSKDILLNYLPVGTVYLVNDKLGIRVKCLDNTGNGTKLNDSDFSSINNIPLDIISSIKLQHSGANYSLKVKGIVVAPKNKAITVDMTIELDKNNYTIANINTTVTEEDYKGKRAVKKSKYSKLAKLLGLKVENDRYIKILKGMTEDLWVYDIDWSPELETIADRVGYDIKPGKDYCYVISDDIGEYVTMMIAEMPNKDFDDTCMSRRFKVKLLVFEESEDCKFATIKIKVDNDIIIETFTKMKFLKEIQKLKEV